MRSMCVCAHMSDTGIWICVYASAWVHVMCVCVCAECVSIRDARVYLVCIYKCTVCQCMCLYTCVSVWCVYVNVHECVWCAHVCGVVHANSMVKPPSPCAPQPLAPTIYFLTPFKLLWVELDSTSLLSMSLMSFEKKPCPHYQSPPSPYLSPWQPWIYLKKNVF